MEVWRSPDGAEIGVIAATWHFNPKITFDSLANEFRTNPTRAWRNYGSVLGAGSLERAIPDEALIIGRVNPTRQHPWDGLFHKYTEWFHPQFGRKYFMHFDLSKNRDATGIAVVHREDDGTLAIDFMHQHRPQEMGGYVNYAQLREWYVYPLTARGFHLELITFDGFQSEETRQVLQEKGYATDYCSADRDPEVYDTLLDFLFTAKLDYYNAPTFLREMKELRRVNGVKYDHPRRFQNGDLGSKDVADAVACATYKAVQYALENPALPPGSLCIYRSPAWGSTYGEKTAFG
jgi:hypothetical protein